MLRWPFTVVACAFECPGRSSRTWSRTRAYAAEVTIEGRDGPGVPSRAEFAARVDHTILRPEATRDEVATEMALAVQWGCASICVQPELVPHVSSAVGGRLAVCSVVGFPHGAGLSRSKADEAAAAVAHGASEIDMVVALGPIAEGDLDGVRHDVAMVREAVPDVLLKVIVESALWTPPVLRDACIASVDAGADMVKTSTGFHPAGGATVAAVRIMRSAVGGRAGVKASGGLRSLADCMDALAAGADRLGLSATGSVLDELTATRR
jgi:deoxyribose-phosphate aldolase